MIARPLVGDEKRIARVLGIPPQCDGTARVFNGFQGFRPAVIQVKINMPDGFDVFLGSR